MIKKRYFYILETTWPKQHKYDFCCSEVKSHDFGNKIIITRYGQKPYSYSMLCSCNTISGHDLIQHGYGFIVIVWVCYQQIFYFVTGARDTKCEGEAEPKLAYIYWREKREGQKMSKEHGKRKNKKRRCRWMLIGIVFHKQDTFMVLMLLKERQQHRDNKIDIKMAIFSVYQFLLNIHTLFIHPHAFFRSIRTNKTYSDFSLLFCWLINNIEIFCFAFSYFVNLYI